MTPHIIIFGASGGIATALRHRAAVRGWNITAVTRSPDGLKNVSDTTEIVEADATTESGTRNAYDKAEEAHGVPTAAVNCIGGVTLKPLHNISAVEFSDAMRLHVFSSFTILKEAVNRMKDGGSVTLVSSAAARTGLPNHEAIAMAKGALEGLVRSAAATYGPKGMRINAVAPGLTETPATAHLCKPPAVEASKKMHVVGRIGQPEDVASALVWLSDPEQSWVSGQILHVDGGLAHLRSIPK